MSRISLRVQSWRKTSSAFIVDNSMEFINSKDKSSTPIIKNYYEIVLCKGAHVERGAALQINSSNQQCCQPLHQQHFYIREAHQLQNEIVDRRFTGVIGDAD